MRRYTGDHGRNRRRMCLLMLNAPLMCEAIRRFVYYSDWLLAAVDLLAVGFAGWLLLRTRLSLSIDPLSAWSAVALVAWGTLSVAGTHANLVIYLVGVRSLFVPLAFLAISAHFLLSEDDGGSRLYVMASIWIVVIGVVAGLQVYLGLSHSINKLPAGVVRAVNEGIGDYVVSQNVLLERYLFRPTSFFLHTGKFGQAVFVLLLFKWLYALHAPGVPRWTVLFVPFDVLTLLLSGQRSAIVFLMASIGLVLSFGRGIRRRAKKASLIGAVALATFFVGGLSDYASEAVGGRIASIIPQVWDRVSVNVQGPAADVLARYAVMGEGFGFYALGSARVGGEVLFESTTIAGAAESGWMRVVAEVGLVGLLMQGLFFAGLIGLAARRARESRVAAQRPMALYSALWLGSMCIWSLTHDTLSNATIMAVGYGFAGVLLLPSVDRAARPPRLRARAAL